MWVVDCLTGFVQSGCFKNSSRPNKSMETWINHVLFSVASVLNHVSWIIQISLNKSKLPKLNAVRYKMFWWQGGLGAITVASQSDLFGSLCVHEGFRKTQYKIIPGQSGTRDCPICIQSKRSERFYHHFSYIRIHIEMKQRSSRITVQHRTQYR